MGDSTRITRGTLASEMKSNFVVPSFRLWRSTDQEIPNTTFTAIAFNNAATFDTDDGHDSVTNNTRYTIQTPGVWSFYSGVRWEASSSGIRHVFIRINGSLAIDEEIPDVDTASTHRFGADTAYALDEGDYVELVVWHNVGAPLDVLSVDASSPYLAGVWHGNTS